MFSGTENPAQDSGELMMLCKLHTTDDVND